MKNTIYYDAEILNDSRRKLLFEMQLFVYSRRSTILAFAKFAKSMIVDAFEEHDPKIAQHEMEAEHWTLLGELKPAFIHHPELKRHVPNIVEDFQCDLNKAFFDVPRMRSSTSGGYLTTGIAYAWHPIVGELG